MGSKKPGSHGILDVCRGLSREDRLELRRMAAGKNNSALIILCLALFILLLIIMPIDVMLPESSAGRSGYQDSYAAGAIGIGIITLAVFIVNFILRKKADEHYRLLNLFTYIFVFSLLSWSLFASINTSMQMNYADVSIYFTVLMIVSAAFYINPFIIVPIIIVWTSSLFIILNIYAHFSFEMLYMPELLSFALAGLILILGRNLSLIRELRSKQQIERYTAELKNAREEADHANAAKSTFLATMSHEIRTPMNAIIGLTEMTLRLDVPARAREYLRQVKSAGSSLLAIINDILDFSKIESGKLAIVPAEYDLAALIADLSSLVKVRIGQKPVELRICIDPGLPRLLYGDDIRIKQILLNLAGNSAKFTESGYIAVVITRGTPDLIPAAGPSAEELSQVQTTAAPGEPSLSAPSIVLSFSVEDTGIGMKPEDLGKLFQSFSQVNMAQNRRKEGTGLGLAISKRLVGLMGGAIGVESEYGKGSCFHFAIPQKPAAAECLRDAYPSAFKGAPGTGPFRLDIDALCRDSNFTARFNSAGESGAGFTAPKAKLLVVDDNLVNLQVAKGLLEPYRCQVDTVESGAGAIQSIINNSYDIVFLDHMMPDMDGIEAEKRIRALVSHADGRAKEKQTIIALTANVAGGAKELFLSSGFDDFLAKPIEVKELDRKLRQWLPADLIEDAPAAQSGASGSGAQEAQAASMPSHPVSGRGILALLSDPDSSYRQKVRTAASIAGAAAVPGLDRDAGIRSTGSADNYESILRTYLKTLDSGADKIEAAAAAAQQGSKEALKTYTILVHALKSSSRVIGAAALSGLAAELEQRGSEGDLAAIAAQTPALLGSYRALKVPIAEHFRQQEAAEPKDSADRPGLSGAELEGFLTRLAQCAADSDLTGADAAIKELQSRAVPDSLRPFADSLAEAVENIDFEQLTALISAHKSA